MTAIKIISTKPYLLRAFYEWILDSGMTPHIIVNALPPEVKVPEQHIENGTITLNISPEATNGLAIGNEWVEFSASFSQVVEHITFPVRAVVGIYAEENNRGLFFSNDDGDDGDDGGDGGGKSRSPNPPPSTRFGSGKKTPSGRPKLRVVK
jgi:stringent starvation protein B